MRSDLEAFIDEKYDNVKFEEMKKDLFISIKCELKEFINDEFKKLNLNSWNKDCQDDFASHEQSVLIHHMEKEINFLRKQLETRDEFIESLISEKSSKKHITHNSQTSYNDTNFQSPRKTVKRFEKAISKDND